MNITGLAPEHLLEHVIRPALDRLGPTFTGPAAERLVLGTAAVESQLTYLVQHGNGPALGLWQMEPATQHSLHRDMLVRRPELRDAVLSWVHPAHVEVLDGVPMPDARALIWCLPYAASMCRLRYLWDPKPLPHPEDIGGLAQTWKRAYNTRLGAGREEDFRHAWHIYCARVFARREEA